MTRNWLRKWAIVVLSGLWLATEVVGAADGDGGIWTLTDVISHYVPQAVTLPAVGVLTAWLAIHFKRQYQAGTGPAWAKAYTGAMTAALGVLGTAVLDDKVTSEEKYAIAAAALAALLAVYHAPNDTTQPGEVRIQAGRPPA